MGFNLSADFYAWRIVICYSEFVIQNDKGLDFLGYFVNNE